MSTTSDPVEERLFGLIEIAERQQAAVQAAIEGLAAQGAALQAERERLGRDVQALNRQVGVAVHGAVTDSMRGAAQTGASALKDATGPLLEKLAGVGAAADQTQATLQRAVSWASGTLFGWGVIGIVVLVLFGWGVSSAVLWWDAGAIGTMQVRKAQLEVDIATMQANHDDWVKAGMLEKIERCGTGNRPCIRVDESVGSFGDQGDYRVILGY